MGEITFLEQKHVFGNKQSEVFNSISKKCIASDFAILLGCAVMVENDGSGSSDRIALWLLKDVFETFYIAKVDYDGSLREGCGKYRVYGARPCVTYSSIKDFCKENNATASDPHTVFYGSYPQTIASKSICEQLEEAYHELIFSTKDFYTTDSELTTNYLSPFTPRTFDVFEHPYGSGNRYIRFVGDRNGEGKTLSDGTVVKCGEPYWIKVEPIKWYVDEDLDLAFTEKIVFSGIQMTVSKNYDGDFDKTEMKAFLDNYFSKEIVQNRNQSYSQIEEDKKEIIESKGKAQRKENPYNFEFESVSEEDIIRGAIDSDIAVFLHGKSSDGKSARVKQIDPDCEIVYLRNATPDSLNGKSVYNEEKGEMIDVPPSWYKKIKEKCERQPDKLHIVFFDELTNALPSIQGMAFNIILDKEVNGVWKLPSNCRIVAAGNDMDDSLAANEMAEPLFNRFSHVYIETTVEKWLKWAAKKENNIHPAIYAYVAYKSCSRSDVLRTKYDGKKPNADPRKWEMASKVLYATKNPEMLRSLIGESLTNDFIAFCNHSVITLEDVIGGNYAEEDIKQMNISEKFATSIGLSKCEEKDLDVVRDFVSKLGAEVLATFDVLVGYKNDSQEVDKKQKNNRR